jgi:hypothetical protein
MGAMVGTKEKRKGARPSVRRASPGPATLRSKYGDPKAEVLQDAEAHRDAPVPTAEEPRAIPLTPEQQTRRDIEDEVAGDIGLLSRPNVRRFRLRLLTESLKDTSGKPLTDPMTGRPMTTTMHDLWLAACMAAIINPKHHRQFEFAEMIGHWLYDKPRQAMELTGANGGPIRSQEVPPEQLSPEEMAQRFVRAAKIAQEIMEKSQAGPLAIEGIEVSSKPAAAPTERGQAVIDVIAAPTAQPSGTAPPATQAPQVGSIIRR